MDFRWCNCPFYDGGDGLVGIGSGANASMMWKHLDSMPAVFELEDEETEEDEEEEEEEDDEGDVVEDIVT